MKFLKHYKVEIMYIMFGIATTVTNLVVYYVFYYWAGISNLLATVVAWILAVLFAFITNKVYVFESKSFNIYILSREILSFGSCRLLTGFLDLIIMVVSVDLMKWNGVVWKIISNLAVIILNYVASKKIVFKNDKN